MSSSISLIITLVMAGWDSLVIIFLVLANFGCVECLNSDSLPANCRGNHMSTFRKATPGVRLGRPPKPVGRGRNRRVVTFVTEDEYAELKVLAGDRSISLSALCNDMVITALRRERR